MAILDIDGFDHYNDETELTRKGWSISRTNSSLYFAYAQSPRFSGYSIGFYNSGVNPGQYLQLIKQLPHNVTVGYFGIGFYVSNSTYGKLISFMDDATYQIGIRINTDLTISVIRNGVAGTVLGTSIKTLALSTWAHLSAEFTIHDSAGTAKVWINGELVLDLSGLDTQQSANAYANKITIYAQETAQSLDFLVDDFYVGDNSGTQNTSCLTEARVSVLYPISSGTYNGWDFSGTSYAWQAIDDTFPDDNTSYIYSSVSGTKSTFEFENLEADADSVFAIQFVNYSRKDDADVRGTKFLMGLPSGTVYEFSTGTYLGSDYQFFTYIQETDPITGDPLTPTIVNDNEYGIVIST